MFRILEMLEAKEEQDMGWVCDIFDLLKPTDSGRSEALLSQEGCLKG